MCESAVPTYTQDQEEMDVNMQPGLGTICHLPAR